MKKVLIMRGVPGSGKSTYVRDRIRNYDEQAEVCSADNFFIKGGNYAFDVTKLGEAHAECFNSFMQAVTFGKPLIVVDNTNVRAWELAAYVQVAKYNGYSVEIVRMDADPGIAAARNVHGVPVGDVICMAKRMEPLPPALGEEAVVKDIEF